MELIPREYLSKSKFSPKVIEKYYPNAKRILTGGLFIAHSGRNYQWILKEIFYPVISSHFYAAYFLHNKESGGSEKNSRPIIQCRLDESNPSILHPSLAKKSLRRIKGKIFTVDFRMSVNQGRAELLKVLSKRIFKFRD